MPQLNRVKKYKSNSVYHIYNRGIDRIPIFRDDYDYRYFLEKIRQLLLKEKKILDEEGNIKYVLPNKRYLGKQINIYAYCLMPNHFHLVIKQLPNRAIVKFMRSLSTSYAMHFNSKYNKSGRLFQGVYRAVLIQTDMQLSTTLDYIHNNPLEIINDLNNYKWSSRKAYNGKVKIDWLEVLGST